MNGSSRATTQRVAKLAPNVGRQRSDSHWIIHIQGRRLGIAIIRRPRRKAIPAGTMRCSSGTSVTHGFTGTPSITVAPREQNRITLLISFQTPFTSTTKTNPTTSSSKTVKQQNAGSDFPRKWRDRNTSSTTPKILKYGSKTRLSWSGRSARSISN